MIRDGSGGVDKPGLSFKSAFGSGKSRGSGRMAGGDSSKIRFTPKNKRSWSDSKKKRGGRGGGRGGNWDRGSQGNQGKWEWLR